jgi:hypothetical protein
MPTVTRPDSSPRFATNVNLYEPGPSSTSAICIGLELCPGIISSARSEKREPRRTAGLSSNSALVCVLAGLLTGLLRLLLLACLLARLTLLLVRLIRLAALLRLALAVLFHVNLQKIAETSFECSSLKLHLVAMPRAN